MKQCCGRIKKFFIFLAIAIAAFGFAGAANFSAAEDKMYQLPETHGKISFFCETCCAGAWNENLGKDCGATDAEKYWFAAMRWPYYDPCTNFSNAQAKEWWHNKKILVANPKNNKKVVLAVKDWGPCNACSGEDCPESAQRRIIDVSKKALDELNAETDDEVYVELAKDQSIALGPVEEIAMPANSILEALARIDKKFIGDVFE